MGRGTLTNLTENPNAIAFDNDNVLLVPTGDSVVAWNFVEGTIRTLMTFRHTRSGRIDVARSGGTFLYEDGDCTTYRLATCEQVLKVRGGWLATLTRDGTKLATVAGQNIKV
jgi:hypothetical protein